MLGDRLGDDELSALRTMLDQVADAETAERRVAN
jgi:hypothetical protein